MYVQKRVHSTSRCFFWHNIFLLVFKKKNNKSYQHQRFLLGGLSLYGHCRCANIFFTLSKKKTKKTLQTGEYKYIFFLHTTHIYTNITPLCHVWSNNKTYDKYTESIHTQCAHGRLEWVYREAAKKIKNLTSRSLCAYLVSIRLEDSGILVLRQHFRVAVATP